LVVVIVVLIGAVGYFVLTNQTGKPTKTTEPISATAKPTVNLKVEPSEISKGESTTLIWSTEKAVTCEASSPTAPDLPFKLNWQGSINLSGTRVYDNVPHDLIFELTCKNAKGDSTFASTIVRTKSTPDSDMVTIKIYFVNSKIKPIDLCNETVSVLRTIPKTEKIATAALNELLKGPTPEEKTQGYASGIPDGSRVNSLTIVNGEARADFNDMIESGSTSCGSLIRVTQIRETLLQFSAIKTVKLSINGRTEDIFQP